MRYDARTMPHTQTVNLVVMIDGVKQDFVEACDTEEGWLKKFIPNDNPASSNTIKVEQVKEIDGRVGFRPVTKFEYPDHFEVIDKITNTVLHSYKRAS